MKMLSLLAALTASTLSFASQANAQSEAQLDQVQSACAVSLRGCVEAVSSLRFGLDQLPNAPRRAAVANIATSLQNQANTAPVDVVQNIAGGLQELTSVIDDPEQLAAVNDLIEELTDGVINDQAAFAARIAAIIQRALAPDSAS